MKICVYTIIKNEEKHIVRWYESAKEADYFVMVDTGSTDESENICKSIPQIRYSKVDIVPWRFDKARNASIDVIPDDTDVCICLDADEILMPGWRQEIERLWQPKITNRMSYNFIWNFLEDGSKGLQFQSEKIHGRHTHKWVNAVHEILQPLVEQVKVDTSMTLIEHHADNSKSRGGYLPLLELDAQENPDNDRNSHYLGREYFLYKRYDEAIKELKRHLALPKAVWKSERAASMRYIAKSYMHKQVESQQRMHFQNAEYWFKAAIAEDTNSKEACMDLAQFYLSLNMFAESVIYAEKCIAISAVESSYLREALAQNEGPYHILGTAYFYLNELEKAKENTEKALAYKPNDKVLTNNLFHILEKLKENGKVG